MLFVVCRVKYIGKVSSGTNGNLINGLYCTETECSELFNNIGNSEVLYVNEELAYTDAERRCREKGSRLAEIRSEDEWSEVI